MAVAASELDAVLELEDAAETERWLDSLIPPAFLEVKKEEAAPPWPMSSTALRLYGSWAPGGTRVSWREVRPASVKWLK
ncbi:hypothetical protein ATCC90586_003146 [Pythium insidiosum]|nr:hypothetical protein ATCC90586_003146 [Pythium insidiosum]